MHASSLRICFFSSNSFFVPHDALYICNSLIYYLVKLTISFGGVLAYILIRNVLSSFVSFVYILCSLDWFDFCCLMYVYEHVFEFIFDFIYMSMLCLTFFLAMPYVSLKLIRISIIQFFFLLILCSGFWNPH